ncbi:Uncharacterised protein [Nocardia africana]|uniref:Uncharacterized protein n=1 Tax=Nocardia africana TaxID=134964 RepID=A0A378X2T9_9NOCA|nr:Uncharacterised protein [Nocardia africana]
MPWSALQVKRLMIGSEKFRAVIDLSEPVALTL